MSGTVDSGGVVMLGPPKPRHLDQPIAVSLAEPVAPSNFYRHLEAQLALGFDRGWVDDDAFVPPAAMTPSPCGFFGDPERACSCAADAVSRYEKR